MALNVKAEQLLMLHCRVVGAAAEDFKQAGNCVDGQQMELKLGWTDSSWQCCVGHASAQEIEGVRDIAGGEVVMDVGGKLRCRGK